MNQWLAQFALPIRAWLPLGLAALAPVTLAAVILPISRRRGRGIATALTLRTVLVLAVGFALLAAVGTVAVGRTGLLELSRRHTIDARKLAEIVEQNPLGLAAGNTQLRLLLARGRDSDFAFVAAGNDGCRAVCIVSVPENRISPTLVKETLARVWPRTPGGLVTVSIDNQPYLLVTSAVRGSRSSVLLGVSAANVTSQAAHTAWLLLAISYALLLFVGTITWKQVSHSLATRIHDMNVQLRSGVADESTHESLEVDGHELRELADSVSHYIKRTLDEKSSSDERHRRLAELSPDAVVLCADRRIRSANPAAIALSGAKNRGDLVASPIDRFLEFVDATPIDGTAALRPATWRRVDGRLLHVEVAEIVDSTGDELVRQFVIRDVTSRRQREADLTHRAEHDALTGLVNRARFDARLHEVLDPAMNANSLRGETREVAVVFIDLDGFKPVNDSHGHAAGDAVLVAVAARLRDSTRGSDLIARFGGDEFAVLLEVRHPFETNTVAERILAALRRPIVHNGIELKIAASLGIASAATVNANPPALLRSADEAMYQAKAMGGDRFVVAGASPDRRTDIRFPAVA
jgi:diguanylate cyclase (GGDEF)-like protein